MSILKPHIFSSAGKSDTQNKHVSGIPVTCPKCQANILIKGLQGNTPVRCSKCNYPMICRSDLLPIIAACKKATTAEQTHCANDLLQRFSEFMPEAGTAIGMLANHQKIHIGDTERWAKLINAYAGGDNNAREFLNLMCASTPEYYEQEYCRSCGAPKYRDKRLKVSSACIYCQTTD